MGSRRRIGPTHPKEPGRVHAQGMRASPTKAAPTTPRSVVAFNIGRKRISERCGNARVASERQKSRSVHFRNINGQRCSPRSEATARNSSLLELEMGYHPPAVGARRDDVCPAEDGKKIVQPCLVRQVGDLKLQGGFVPLVLEKVHPHKPIPDGAALDARGSSLEC